MASKSVINSANTIKGNSLSVLKAALADENNATKAVKEIPTKVNYKKSSARLLATK